jgi:hypothetical protein
MKVFKSALSPTQKKVEAVKGKRGMYAVKNAYTGSYDYFRAPEQEASKGEHATGGKTADLKK